MCSGTPYLREQSASRVSAASEHQTVDRDNVEEKRDDELPKEPGTKRLAGGDAEHGRRRNSRLLRPPRAGLKTGRLT
jgi:hypothetical protein